MQQNNFPNLQTGKTSSAFRSRSVFWSFVSLAGFLIFFLASKKFDARLNFDAFGNNVGSIAISEAGANFGDWGVSWGWLMGKPVHNKGDLGLHFRVPKYVRVYWKLGVGNVARWVPVEGSPSLTAPDERPDLVVEIDPECERAKAFWIAQYEGPVPDRRVQTTPRDCTMYSDEPWTDQAWEK